MLMEKAEDIIVNEKKKKNNKESQVNNNVLVKTCFYVFMISLFCVNGAAKEETVQSMWAETPLIIDASIQEWAGASLYTEKKTYVDCAFKNDLDNLYVLFVFNDPDYLSTSEATGITLWFSSVKKKKKNYGINFKVKKISADDLIAVLERQKGPLPDEERAKIRSIPQYFIFRGDVIDKKGEILTASLPLFKTFLAYLR